MLLPDQPGALPHLAAAGGKHTGVLLLNRDNLGGYGNAQLFQDYVGDCWCGSSYFSDASKTGHVVVSAGNAIAIFSVQTSPTVALVNQIEGPVMQTGQDPGFFTTVSSNGTAPGTALVWAISRPVNANPGYINLYAFDATTAKELLGIRAGIWRSPQGDANLVPTVANGHVFVASYNQLAIFGLGTPAAPVRIITEPGPAEPALAAATPHQLSGVRVAGTPHGFTLRTRTGELIAVDASGATHFGAEAQPDGTKLLLRGDYTRDGGFKAVNVLHLKGQPALWPSDR